MDDYSDDFPVRFRKNEHLGRRGDTVFQPNSRRQFFHIIVRYRTIDFNLIRLWKFIPRVHQPVCKIAIIGEKKNTGGITVEPPDGKQPVLRFHIIKNRRPSLLVTQGRNTVFRLVEEDILTLIINDCNLFLMVINQIVPRIDFCAEIAYNFSVDTNLTARDKLIRLATRSDSGLR